jgi:hypothetical protein
MEAASAGFEEGVAVAMAISVGGIMVGLGKRFKLGSSHLHPATKAGNLGMLGVPGDVDYSVCDDSADFSLV